MSESAFWNDDWMKLQQNYWESWSELSRKAMGMETPPKAPWESAMDHWWQAVSPAAPDMTQDFMHKMMEQGKTFFRMGDEFSRSLAGGKDWMEAVNQTFGEMQKAFSGGLEQGFSASQKTGDDVVHKMMAFWEMPLDNWQRMVSSLSLAPGDLLRNMPHGGGIDRFLSAPGLGYAREEERQYKDLMQSVLVYQRAFGEYLGFFSNLGLLSVDRIKEKVEAKMEKGESIDSARALYDLWVGACEEVYGEQVMTPDYAKLHGELVNALMALKKKMGNLVDENLGAMNMPTRRELRTLQDRLQETRRENKSLRLELEALKEQMLELRKPGIGKPEPADAAKAATAKAAPRKKAPARKKTAVKKPSTSKE
jgi:class III poly(R)-hydroxyalkanoic acid synthase PhaE subunit